MAQLRRLREMFPEELVVIGVHSAKFPTEMLTENIRQAVMRLGIEHPVVNDAGFKTWNAYAVRAWPTLVLVDPNGRIAGETSGEILAEEFAANITELIQLDPEAIDRRPLSALDIRPEASDEPSRPLAYPARLLVADDRLFLADTGHHRVIELRLEPDGRSAEVLRVFGSGQPAFLDGPPTQAAFRHPRGLGLLGDPHTGTLYVADTENHAVRAIDLASGAVTTIAGTGQKAHGRLALDRPTATPLRSPWAVLPVENALLIAMAGSHQIWVLLDGERLGPFAGNGHEALEDGPVGESSFNQPSDLALGMGYLFVADPEASAIRAISLGESPATQTLVGQGLFDFGDQDGETGQALLQHPTGLSFSGERIYVADTYNNKIKLLDPQAGRIETLVGSGLPGHSDGPFEQAELFEPEGVLAVGERLYIADTNNHLVRVADLATRQVHTLRLRGLERLAMAEAAPEVLRLAPVQLGPGPVRLELDAHLPAGYHRNPEAPTVLRIGQPAAQPGVAAIPHTGEAQAARVLTFEAGQPLAISLNLASSQDLALSLTLYYCQEDDARLCLIHDRQLLIPLMVTPGGPSEARIDYRMEQRGP